MLVFFILFLFILRGATLSALVVAAGHFLSWNKRSKQNSFTRLADGWFIDPQRYHQISAVISSFYWARLLYILLYPTDSTFSFLVESWKDHLPPGFMVKEAYIDQPFEEDTCRCHFTFANLSSDSELVLKYQWFLGDRTPTNFVPITHAVGEV